MHPPLLQAGRNTLQGHGHAADYAQPWTYALPVAECVPQEHHHQNFLSESFARCLYQQKNLCYTRQQLRTPPAEGARQHLKGTMYSTARPKSTVKDAANSRRPLLHLCLRCSSAKQAGLQTYQRGCQCPRQCGLQHLQRPLAGANGGRKSKVQLPQHGRHESEKHCPQTEGVCGSAGTRAGLALQCHPELHAHSAGESIIKICDERHCADSSAVCAACSAITHCICCVHPSGGFTSMSVVVTSRSACQRSDSELPSHSCAWAAAPWLCSSAGMHSSRTLRRSCMAGVLALEASCLRKLSGVI